jgi:eukaryotic-like serine/threonine-protein kinase
VAEYAPPISGGLRKPGDLLSRPSVNVGDVVDKYRLERVIGVGAMGLVMAARHTTLDQIVAIKFLVEHRFGSQEESIARFLGEARAAARIDSDHVCRVSDVGMLPNGVPYMIMEYLEGNDLEEEIVSRGQLDLIESVDYVLQALDAMAAAHQLGIVHRDLKPANLFLALRPDGSRRVKVLDFGISKAETMGKPRLTRETKSLGTPAYMPPEQIKDPMGVDHRADIWALGAILYELLTGQMAFVGESITEVLDRVLGESPCPIEALRRDVPPELIGIIGRALARDRYERWPTVALFARALSPYGSIGVTSTLTNISREVGSLSSISSISASAVRVASARSHGSQEPVVANVSREPTLPDWNERSRRYNVVQDWAALQTRKRRARAAVLMMVAALLLASSIVVLVYRVGTPRVLATRPTTSVDALTPRLRSDEPPPENGAAGTPKAAASLAPVVAPAASSPVLRRDQEQPTRHVYPAGSTPRPVPRALNPAAGAPRRSPPTSSRE